MSLLRHMHIPSLFLLFACALTLGAQDWKTYPHTPDGSLISFPEDEGWHPSEAIEWWYVAGHLEGAVSGSDYSFMLSYFFFPGDTFGIAYDGFRILNVSNESSGEFHSETMLVNYADLDSTRLHIDARLLNDVEEFWYHKEEGEGTLIPFEYELSAESAPGDIALSLVSRKRPLIPGGDGLFNQGASSYTYYYSLTDVAVEGSIRFEGSSEAVTGTAWIDRQYGSFNPYSEEAYEWFFLQLSNGMDLNIWNLFTPEKQLPDDPAYRHLSAYVDEDTQYTTHDFELERLSWARMPGTENCYAQSWRLQSETDQLDLTITTLHNNSEVLIPFNFFEGPVSLSGYANGDPVSGIGFAELVNTYDPPDIELVSPKRRWNDAFPIRWELHNPDDGRPLLYDLAYSIDQGDSWTPVSEGITDTFTNWSNHPFVNGDSCLFRVEGYTADHTLSGMYEASVHTVYDDQYTLSQSESLPEFHIYPNPTGDFLRIAWDGLSGIPGEAYSFRILDYGGRTLMKGRITQREINLSRLESGTYLLELRGPGGSMHHVFHKN